MHTGQPWNLPSSCQLLNFEFIHNNTVGCLKLAVYQKKDTLYDSYDLGIPQQFHS